MYVCVCVCVFVCMRVWVLNLSLKASGVWQGWGVVGALLSNMGSHHDPRCNVQWLTSKQERRQEATSHAYTNTESGHVVLPVYDWMRGWLYCEGTSCISAQAAACRAWGHRLLGAHASGWWTVCLLSVSLIVSLMSICAIVRDCVRDNQPNQDATTNKLHRCSDVPRKECQSECN